MIALELGYGITIIPACGLPGGFGRMMVVLATVSRCHNIVAIGRRRRDGAAQSGDSDGGGCGPVTASIKYLLLPIAALMSTAQSLAEQIA